MTKEEYYEKEFIDWLWETDRKTFALIMLGHRELLETKYEEFERAKVPLLYYIPIYGDTVIVERWKSYHKFW